MDRGEALTQFGRAMQELDIHIVCANIPQAKGRVERVIQTLQDRLPKEMPLRGVASREAGNAYLPEFMQDFNQRFGEEPRGAVDAHRPLTTKDNLAQILTWQETRSFSKNLTLQFQNTGYQVQTPRPTYALRNAQVKVCVNANNELSIWYKEQQLEYTLYQPQTQQSQVVLAKNLDQTLASHTPTKPAPDHPWRNGFPTPLAKNKNDPAARGGVIPTLS